MSPELDRKLCEKYPKIFADRYGNPQETLMCWGFECGDGWYTLLDNLCNWLQHSTDLNSNKYPQVVAVQVKEKFGGLRFYVERASSEQYEVIHFVESLANKTCDVCGKPGKRVGSNWIRTRCEEHETTDS